MVPVSNEKSIFHSQLYSELSRIIKKKNHQKIPVLRENQETSYLKMVVALD